ncbi:hypothetical protein A4_380 [Escherichia phage A4]|nr:hypothetical protein A4_380 [Escherichia phage A4]
MDNYLLILQIYNELGKLLETCNSPGRKLRIGFDYEIEYTGEGIATQQMFTEENKTILCIYPHEGDEEDCVVDFSYDSSWAFISRNPRMKEAVDYKEPSYDPIALFSTENLEEQNFQSSVTHDKLITDALTIEALARNYKFDFNLNNYYMSYSATASLLTDDQLVVLLKDLKNYAQTRKEHENTN